MPRVTLAISQDSPLQILQRTRKVRFRSPRSIPPRWLLFSPQSLAKLSWVSLKSLRSAWILLPNRRSSTLSFSIFGMLFVTGPAEIAKSPPGEPVTNTLFEPFLIASGIAEEGATQGKLVEPGRTLVDLLRTRALECAPKRKSIDERGVVVERWLKSEPSNMKKIEAIIKPSKLDDVREALIDIGGEGVTVSEVKMLGRQADHTAVSRGDEYYNEFLPKLKFDIVVADSRVRRTIRAIVGKARTGRINDGRVFVVQSKRRFASERESAERRRFSWYHQKSGPSQKALGSSAKKKEAADPLTNPRTGQLDF
jgi:nitrogen regulatory protein P-II 1